MNDTPITIDDPRELARLTVRVLGRRDAELIAHAFITHPHRVAVLLGGYAGEPMTGDHLAQAMLAIAKRVLREGEVRPS